MTFDVMFRALHLSAQHAKDNSMRFAIPVLLAASLLGGFAAAQSPPHGEISMTDHAHDFDFLIGNWRVHHWRLKDRLAGSHEWVEFEGSCRMWMTMDGHGTVDDNVIGLPEGSYRAVGIRAYDPKTQTWAIWWLDARNPHSIEPPVIGNFKD